MSTDPQRSGDLAAEVVQDVSRLVNLEIALAKQELKELAIRDGIGMQVTLPAVRGIDKRVMLFGEGPSGIVLVIRTADEPLVRAIASEHDVPLWTLGTVGGDLLEVAPVLGTPVSALADAHAHGLGRALGRDA